MRTQFYRQLTGCFGGLTGELNVYAATSQEEIRLPALLIGSEWKSLEGAESNWTFRAETTLTLLTDAETTSAEDADKLERDVIRALQRFSAFDLNERSEDSIVFYSGFVPDRISEIEADVLGNVPVRKREIAGHYVVQI